MKALILVPAIGLAALIAWGWLDHIVMVRRHKNRAATRAHIADLQGRFGPDRDAR